MLQSLTLLFGSKAATSEDLATQLEPFLGVAFEAKSSLYLGEYFYHEGEVADKLSVRNNFVPGFGLAESDHREYQVLVYAYFYSGTESEQVEKFLAMRDKLMGLEGLDLIRDAIEETDEEEM